MFLEGVQEITISPKGNDFYDALLDDLNTPLALSALERLADDVSKMSAVEMQIHGIGLRLAANLLGLLQEDPEAWFKGGQADSDVGHIEAQIALRLKARKTKDFAEADSIRDTLAENGIILEDRPDGSTDWRRAG